MDDPVSLVRDAAGYLLARWRDERSEASRGFDEAHGVETARWTLSGYEPTPVATIDEVLDTVPISVEGATFVDVGAGKGRVLLVAARRPFARVLGVELDGSLVRIARRNLQNATDPARRCPDVSILGHDATDVAWPVGPLVLYLYNPFPAEEVDHMLRGLEASLAVHPRPCALVYINPLFVDVLARRGWRAGATGGQGTERWVWFAPPATHRR